MSFRYFLKQCIMQFFIITTLVTLATAVMGPYLMPNIVVKYDTFYSPLLVGLIATLPSFILFSRKELDLRHTIYRRLLHLLALEVLLCVLNWFGGNLGNTLEMIVFILMVLGIYLVVNFVSYFYEKQDAKRINEGLKELQNQNKENGPLAM